MTPKDTTEATNELHPSQTLEAAKRAAAILQEPPITIAEQDLTSVYVDFGAGRALGINNAGRFSMHSLERDGRASVVLTRDETEALYRFWIPICGELIMQRITEAVAEGKAEQAAKSELAELLEERKQERRQTRVIDIAVAPNCEPDTLSYPPRVVTIDGVEYLQLKGNNGWMMDAKAHGSVQWLSGSGGRAYAWTRPGACGSG